MPPPLNIRTDSVALAYLLATAVLIVLFRARVAGWAVLTGLHLVGALFVWWLRSREGRAWQVLHDWYPLLTYPVFFKEVEFLAAAFGNWSLTEPIRHLETALFGGHPSIYWSESWPWAPLSEYFHFCYLFYMVMIPVVGGCWYATSRKRAFRELILLLSVTFYGSYLFFMLFPVDSPFYLSEPLEPPLSTQLFYNLVHGISSRAGARGAAFPSAHASGSLIVVLVAWRRHRKLAYGLIPIVAGILGATIYGRFHYALDTIAGAALAVLVFGVYQRLASDDDRQLRPA